MFNRNLDEYLKTHSTTHLLNLGVQLGRFEVFAFDDTHSFFVVRILDAAFEFEHAILALRQLQDQPHAANAKPLREHNQLALAPESAA